MTSYLFNRMFLADNSSSDASSTNSSSSSYVATSSASDTAGGSSQESSSSFDFLTYYPEPASSFSTAFFALGLASVVILPILLYFHRKHSLVQARYPYICATEVVIVGMVLMFTSSQQSNPLWYGWGITPCWLYNAIETAISAVLWNVTATRLVLFYRVAQLNTWAYAGKASWMERFIHWFGIINAPYEFQRCEARLAILLSEQEGNSLSGPTLSRTESSASVNVDLTFLKRWTEPFVWFAKLLAWFLGWSILAIVITYGTSWWNYTEGLAYVDEDCYAVSTYLIEAQLIFWNILQCGVVLTWLRNPSDSLGLKTELIFMQCLYLAMWITDAAQILAYPNDYNTQGIYMDLPCMLIHGMVTALYPIVLLYWRRFQQRRLKTQYANKKVIDAEELWSRESGRHLITSIVAKNLAVENTLFLSATDKADNMQYKKLRSIYDRFISASAPFEINIPGKMRTEWDNLFNKKEQTISDNYMQVITATRGVVFAMLTTNYSHLFLTASTDIEVSV